MVCPVISNSHSLDREPGIAGRSQSTCKTYETYSRLFAGSSFMPHQRVSDVPDSCGQPKRTGKTFFSVENLRIRWYITNQTLIIRTLTEGMIEN